MMAPSSPASDAAHGVSASSAEHLLLREGVNELVTKATSMKREAASKRTELQLMVGSRYHELIESADHISTMKSNVVKVSASLQGLGPLVKELCDDMAAANASRRLASSAKDSAAPAATDAREQWVAGAATAWQLMDAFRFAHAAVLLRNGGAEGDASEMECILSVEAQACLLRAVDLEGDAEQAFDAMIDRDAQAITCLALLGAVDLTPSDLLGAFLKVQRRRLQRSMAALRDASPSQTVERLASAVKQLQFSTIGGHQLITARAESLLEALCRWEEPASGGGGGGGAAAAALQALRAGPAPPRALLTAFLKEHCTALYDTSRAFMVSCESATALSELQSALHDVASLRYSSGLLALWRECCEASLGEVALGAEGEPGQRARKKRELRERGGEGSGDIDLWTLIFGPTMDSLVRSLLQEAVQGFAAQGLLALQAFRESAARLSAGAPGLPSPFACDRVVFDAMAKLKRLAKKLRSRCESIHQQESQSRTLLELCCNRAVCFVHHFRRSAAEAAGGATSAAEAFLLCRMLFCFAGDFEELSALFRAKKARRHARASVQQLQAAFDIADTDGDDMITLEEAKDAIDAVCPIGAARPNLDFAGLEVSQLSFRDFNLLCAQMLDLSDAWATHVAPQLEESLREALRAVARKLLSADAAALRSAYAQMHGASLCLDDRGWRSYHKCWRQSSVKSEDFSEEIWFPRGPTDALLRLFTRGYVALQSATHLQDAVGGFLPMAHAALAEELAAQADGAAGALLARKLRSRGSYAAANGAGSCEHFVLQMLVDARVLRCFLEASAAEGSEVRRLEETLLGLVDPVNWQLYEPFVHAICGTALDAVEAIAFRGAAARAKAGEDAKAPPEADGAAEEDRLQSALPACAKKRRIGLLAIPMALQAAPAEAEKKDSKSSIANAFSFLLGDQR